MSIKNSKTEHNLDNRTKERERERTRTTEQKLGVKLERVKRRESMTSGDDGGQAGTDAGPGVDVLLCELRVRVRVRVDSVGLVDKETLTARLFLMSSSTLTSYCKRQSETQSRLLRRQE